MITKTLLGFVIMIALQSCATNPTDSVQNPSTQAFAKAEIIKFLFPLAQIESNFMLRQKLLGSFRGQDFHGEVIIQKLAGELTIIALTPFGSKAFAIKQTSERIDSVSFIPQQLVFPPELMVLDIHRSLFIGSNKSDKPQNGVINFVYKGVGIRETWNKGQLKQRLFFAKNKPKTVEFTINYGEGMHDFIPPAEIELFDHRIGYRIRVITSHFEPLS